MAELGAVTENYIGQDKEHSDPWWKWLLSTRLDVLMLG